MRKVRKRKRLETEQQMGKARVKMEYLTRDRSSFGQILKVALESSKDLFESSEDLFESSKEKLERATQKWLGE